MEDGGAMSGIGGVGHGDVIRLKRRKPALKMCSQLIVGQGQRRGEELLMIDDRGGSGGG